MSLILDTQITDTTAPNGQTQSDLQPGGKPLSPSRSQREPSLKFNAFLRKWHIQMGAVLAIPAVVVCVTAILMAHNQALDLRNIPLNLAWLPGYQNSGQKAAEMEIRSALTTTDHRYLIGTRFGLWELKNKRLEQITAIPEVEVRSIKETPTGLVLASRKGVWLSKNNHWKKIYKGDAWEVEVLPNQNLRVAAKNKGFLESADGGKHWVGLQAINNLPYVLSEGVPQEEMNLGRLVLDLHTGRAWVGKQWAWLWIDILASALVFIALSGLILKSKIFARPSKA